MYAAGKIPGSFFAWRASAADQATLTAASSTARCARASPTASATRSTSSAPIWARTWSTRTTSWPSTAPRPPLISGTPLRRPHRRRADRLRHRRRGLRTPPTRRARLHLRAGGRRTGPDRGRRQRDRHHDGGGRRHREVLGLLRVRCTQGHRGGPGRWPRGREAVDPRVDRTPAHAGRLVQRRAGPIRPSPSQPSPTTRTTSGPGSRRSAPSRSPRPTWSPARPSGTQRSTPPADEIRPRWATSSPMRPGEVKAAIRSLTKKLVRTRIVEDGVRIDRSRHVGHPSALGRDRPVPDGTTAPRSSSVARPRCSTSRRSACRADEPAARHHPPVESKRYMHHYNFVLLDR